MTLLGGLSFFPPGMAVLLYRIPVGPDHPTWNSLQTLLVVLVMVSSTWVTGFLNLGLLFWKTAQSSGKSSTPLLFLVFYGAISGLERNSSFTMITKLWWTFGPQALPVTPSPCTLSAPYSLLLLPTT